MAYDAARRKVVLFGGQAGLNHLGDTWTWDGVAGTWTHHVADPSPPARRHFGMAYDARSRKVLLFGGLSQDPVTGGNIYFNDTWLWDGASWTEVQQPPGEPWPQARFLSTVTEGPGGSVVMFGGNETVPSPDPSLDDTWTWDGVAGTWTHNDVQNRPGRRSEASAAFHSPTGSVILFGGFKHDSPPNQRNYEDTWRWNGVGWERLEPVIRPSPRQSSHMAEDPATGTVLLFGGVSNPGHLHHDDTWTYPHDFTPPGPLRLRLSDAPAVREVDPGEATVSAVFGLTLDRVADSDVQFHFRTRAGSATAGRDFEAREGDVTIPGGEQTALVEVPIIADNSSEPTESFQLQISSEAAEVIRSVATVQILDDDVAAAPPSPSPSPGPQSPPARSEAPSVARVPPAQPPSSQPGIGGGSGAPPPVPPGGGTVPVSVTSQVPVSVPSSAPADASAPVSAAVPAPGAQPGPLVAGYPQLSERPAETPSPEVPKAYAMVGLSASASFTLLIFLAALWACGGAECWRQEARWRGAACPVVVK